MNIEFFLKLLDYNYAAHHKVWKCIEKLTDEQFIHVSDYSVGSVRNQVVHTMGAEWVWQMRLNGESGSMFNYDDFPIRESVRTKWDEVEQAVRTYVGSLTNAQLTEVVSYRGLSGGSFSNQRWEMLLQMIPHGVDHRAQVLALLHQLGTVTVAQDWVFYLRDLK